MDYYDQLRAWRMTNKLSQKQVADYLNIDRSTYAYYELGRTRLHVDILVSLAKLYGVSLDALIYGKPGVRK